jgi:hypothetical protein
LPGVDVVNAAKRLSTSVVNADQRGSTPVVNGIQRPKTSPSALSGLISHVCHLIRRVCANRFGAKRPKLCSDESRHHQRWQAGEAQTLRRRSGFSQPQLNFGE